MPSVPRKSSLSGDLALTTALESWFSERQRELPWRASYDPYLVWVSEIMLQQTRVDVVVPYFERFVERFPRVADLAEASLDDVLALWSGLGYYRRARMMHAAAQEIVALGGFPRDTESLRKIRGIGRYTAGAIASIAFGERAAIVDGNVARVLSRVKAIEDEYGSNAFQEKVWAASEALVTACESPRDLNQGLMELGALVCRVTKPLCDECPLGHTNRSEVGARPRAPRAATMCEAHERGIAEALPTKRAKRKATRLSIPLFLVRDDDGRILLRLESGGLMTGMFHLLHGNSKLLRSSADRVVAGKKLGEFAHTVTHRRITFVVKSARLRDALRESSDEYRWIAPSDLSSVPHPSYVTKAMRVAKV